MDITGFSPPPNATAYASPVAGELTKTLKTGRGRLHYLLAANTTAAKIYLFVYDNTAASGTLLMPPIPIAANDAIAWQPFAALFGTGCTVSASTTQTVYTAAGANSIQLHALTS